MANVQLVDMFDRPLAIMSKEEAHSSPPSLHRAFSVFIHDGAGNMLLQRRAMEKYHSGGLWTNACCSHPLKSPELTEQARSRMLFELGFECPLEEIFTYTYFHRFSAEVAEYEYDHVLIGCADAGITPAPQPEEVMEWRWAAFDDLLWDVMNYPDKYSVWFIGTVGRVIEEIRKRYPQI